MKTIDDKHYPIWHPYTHQHQTPLPITIKKAQGVYLIDDKGKKYIDGISSWWVNVLGHCNPTIANAIAKQATQLEQVVFASFSHSPAFNLSHKLLNILPSHFKKVFFSDNGSTAVEVAIKMAIQYHHNLKHYSRIKILALKHSYHGDTFGAMSVSDKSIFNEAFEKHLFSVDYIDMDDKNVIVDLQKKDLNQYACFIYEPLVQGAGGMKMYDANTLNKILKILKRNDIITIADEVMTGFGRTGKLFASEYISTPADIMCLSKGITGGFLPLGITVASLNIYKVFCNKNKSYTFYHGHSYTANPLSCAAACASIDLLQKKSIQRQWKMINTMYKTFQKELKIYPTLVHNSRICGTIFAFELGQDSYSYNHQYVNQLKQMFLENGVFLRPLGNTIYIMPPYIIKKTELLRVFEVIKKMLNLYKKLLIDDKNKTKQIDKT